MMCDELPLFRLLRLNAVIIATLLKRKLHTRVGGLGSSRKDGSGILQRMALLMTQSTAEGRGTMASVSAVRANKKAAA